MMFQATQIVSIITPCALHPQLAPHGTLTSLHEFTLWVAGLVLVLATAPPPAHAPPPTDAAKDPSPWYTTPTPTRPAHERAAPGHVLHLQSSAQVQLSAQWHALAEQLGQPVACRRMGLVRATHFSSLQKHDASQPQSPAAHVQGPAPAPVWQLQDMMRATGSTRARCRK